MFSFEEVLKWIDENKFQFNNKVILNEKENDGKAELIFISNNKLFAISLSHKNKISIFKNQKIADWIILEFIEQNMINLHILELKRTIKDSVWQKVKQQFEGALQHSFLLKGLFNYEIKEIFLYTGFVNDKFDSKNTANPVLLKNTLGIKEIRTSLDWHRNEINILGKILKHKKIILKIENNIGKGQKII